MLTHLGTATKLALATLAISTLAQSVEASHFRYGHVTWRPGAGANEIDFTVVNAWRYNGYAGTGPGGSVAVGDVITENIGGTRMLFGDGATTPTLQYKVSAINPTDNWLIATALEPGSTTKETLTHTYSGTGPFVAAIDSCCRIGGIQNGGGGYRVETIVTLDGNSSPVSSLPTIVDAPVSTAWSINVPGADPDPNTTLQWRFATLAEQGGNFTIPGDMAIDTNTGLLTWTTPAGALGDLYTIQVIVEDRDSNTGALKTKVGVDFFIRLVDNLGNPPRFDPPSPCNSTIMGTVGVPLSFQVTASDPDPGDIVTLNSGNLPQGASTNPVLPTTGNPVSATFNWTPNTQGAFVVNFTATSTGGQATCPVTINIAECFLFLGMNRNNLQVGDPNDLLYVDPLAFWPVTMDDIPSWQIPNDPSLNGAHVLFQVGMYNWVMFQGDPIQMSQGLDVTLGQGSTTYGQNSGIDLWLNQAPTLGGTLEPAFNLLNLR